MDADKNDNKDAKSGSRLGGILVHKINAISAIMIPTVAETSIHDVTDIVVTGPIPLGDGNVVKLIVKSKQGNIKLTLFPAKAAKVEEVV